jgi:hypothetical protein
MADSGWRDRLTFREFFMTKYEFKVVYSHVGEMVFPWTSQEVRDKCGRRGLEKSLNGLADEEWEIVSCTTSSLGWFFFFSPFTTIILRREKT